MQTSGRVEAEGEDRVTMGIQDERVSEGERKGRYRMPENPLERKRREMGRGRDLLGVVE